MFTSNSTDFLLEAVLLAKLIADLLDASGGSEVPGDGDGVECEWLGHSCFGTTKKASTLLVKF